MKDRRRGEKRIDLTLSVLYGCLFFLNWGFSHSGKSRGRGTIPMMHQVRRDHARRKEMFKVTLKNYISHCPHDGTDYLPLRSSLNTS